MSEEIMNSQKYATMMANAAMTNRYLTDEAKAAYAIALRDRDLGIQSDDKQLATKIKIQLLTNKLTGKACELARLMAMMGIRFGISCDKYGGKIVFDCNGNQLTLAFNSEGNLMNQHYTKLGNLTECVTV